MSQLNLAEQHYKQGAFSKAMALLDRLDPATAQTPEALLLRGVCLARERRPAEAKQALSQLLEISPDSYEALTWMSMLHKNRDSIDRAVAYAQRAVAIRPEDSAGHSNLGSCLLYLRQPAPAIEAFERAIALAPEMAEHHFNLGLAYQMVPIHREAEKQFRMAIALAPQAVQGYLALASQYSLFGHTGEAIECLSNGLIQLPDSPQLHISIAAAFATLRNDGAAEAHYRRAMELSEDSRAAFASWLINQGRFEESEALYRQLLIEKKNPGLAYYGIMQSRKLGESDRPLIEEMESTRGMPGLTPVSEMHLEYALGKAHEQLMDYGAAMRGYDRANALAYRIHNAGSPLAVEGLKQHHEKVKECWSDLAQVREESPPETSPIFIVGMIRAGTTLLEQIISSHPMVKPAGELRFWIEEGAGILARREEANAEKLREIACEYTEYSQLLAGKAKFITNKMPLNFDYVGIIARAMPDAKFIHIKRHPVDTCLSIYTTYFGKGPQFAYDKQNIVHYYKQYLETIDFWRQSMPSDIFTEVEYEELVADPVAIIPPLIDFCGLPWDEATLRHEENDTPINTPSRWQARQPVYRTSTERWRKFEPWLGPFAELLSDNS